MNTVNLERGFVIIVGQNNSGKSALLEALNLNFSSRPHQNSTTKPNENTPLKTISKVEVVIELEHKEILKILNQGKEFYLPINDQNRVEDEVKWFLYPTQPRFFKLKMYVTAEGVIDRTIIPEFAANMSVKVSAKGSGEFKVPTIRGNSNEYQLTHPDPDQLFMMLVAQFCQKYIYTFQAERLNVGRSRLGTENNLNSNASNLPEVLLNLSNDNPSRFNRFNDLVQTVFPQIKRVMTSIVSQNEVEIRVWNENPSEERSDLALPLSEGGTGVGQVLAILYVVLSSTEPRIIAIDEPQSFLHPGAIRKLIDILKQYPQHQYLITTHSPAVISASDPSTVLLVTKQNSESSIEVLDRTNLKSLDRILTETGTRLSDVFGADEILWVEGPTEATCYPLILSSLVNHPLYGRAILSVKHTADFDHPVRAKTAVEIYKRLSEAGGLIPPAIGFIFDREARTPQEQADLKRQSGNTVFFTKRKMYENYLLRSQALSAVMNATEGFATSPIDDTEIDSWLDQHKWERKYFMTGTSLKASNQTEEFWLTEVDGAKILNDLFNHFSQTRVSYDKIYYGRAITEWLIEKSPQDLEEIVVLLKEALKIQS